MQRDGRVGNLALKGADLLDKAADRLATSGWIETGMVVLLLGRALVGGHRLAKAAREAGRKVRLVRVIPSAAPEPLAPQVSDELGSRAEDASSRGEARPGERPS